MGFRPSGSFLAAAASKYNYKSYNDPPNVVIAEKITKTVVHILFPPISLEGFALCYHNMNGNIFWFITK